MQHEHALLDEGVLAARPAGSLMARQSGIVAHEVSTERSLFVAARMLAHPATRSFVGGLRMQDLPCNRHPSYAASIFYRFRTFTLWIHGDLQTSQCAWQVARIVGESCARAVAARWTGFRCEIWA